MYRAVLEGVALEYCIYRDVLQSVNPELSIREVRVTGGGEKSELWNQIKADALRIPVLRIDRQEGAPLGVAMLAGYGVGLFKKLEAAAARWICRGHVTRPSRKLAAHYRQRLARYAGLLEHLDQWAKSE
jgi:xylulokinase